MTPERIAEIKERAVGSPRSYDIFALIDALEVEQQRAEAAESKLERREKAGFNIATNCLLLRAALEKYAQHTHKCQRITRSCCLNHEFPCTCGLEKILGEVILGETPSVDKK